jgi:hypothetical protein
MKENSTSLSLIVWIKRTEGFWSRKVEQYDNLQGKQSTNNDI